MGVSAAVNERWQIADLLAMTIASTLQVLRIGVENEREVVVEVSELPFPFVMGTTVSCNRKGEDSYRGGFSIPDFY